MRVPGDWLEKFHEALVGAFSKESLGRFLRFRLDTNLQEIGGSDLSEIVFSLLDWAEKQGRLPKLVEEACAWAPENKGFQEAKDRLRRAEGDVSHPQEVDEPPNRAPEPKGVKRRSVRAQPSSRRPTGRSLESGTKVIFQTSGVLTGAAFYVERVADRELFDVLHRGESCYVLAPRYLGKSSLCVRTSRQLEKHGIHSVCINLIETGSPGTDLGQWYLTFLGEIARKLKLKAELETYWEQSKRYTAANRWRHFFDEILLPPAFNHIVIFVDEVDRALSLSFPRDVFFDSIRAVLGISATHSECARITWCLVGVDGPGGLDGNSIRAEFNTWRWIYLEDFTSEEAAGYLPGLQGFGGDPAAWLERTLYWTEGHPYMTQHVLQRIGERLQRLGPVSHGAESGFVDDVVRTAWLTSGWSGDAKLSQGESHPMSASQLTRLHSAPANAWLLSSADQLRQHTHSDELIDLYGRLLGGERLQFDRRNPMHVELVLTGMVAPRADASGNWLRVRNRIFATVFNKEWVGEYSGRKIVTEIRELFPSRRVEGSEADTTRRLNVLCADIGKQWYDLAPWQQELVRRFFHVIEENEAVRVSFAFREIR